MQSARRVALLIASLGLAFGLQSSAIAESVTVVPKGEYTQIDTRLARDTIQTLAKGAPTEKQNAVASITTHPDNYAPPVFYALSHALFQEGKKDEGAFWFYAGQLRARFDANRCADVSARQAVGALNQSYGSLINQYALQDIPKLESLVLKVIEWDKNTPHNYDHRWINLHGMSAMMSGLGTKVAPGAPATLSLPKDQWDSIAEKTRDDYLSGFQQAMASMKNKQ